MSSPIITAPPANHTSRSRTSATAPSTQPIPFLRIVNLELSKFVSTLHARIAVVVCALVSLAITLVAGVMWARTPLNEGASLSSMIGVATVGIVLLVPVLTILSIASEWSHRTHLSTFSLIPNRSRVWFAKLTAVMAMSYLAMILCALLALVVYWVFVQFGALTPVWDFGLNDGGAYTIIVTASVLSAFGLGSVFLNPTLAIIAHFIIPIVLSPLLMWPVTAPSAPWWHLSTTLNNLQTEAVTSTMLAQLATSSTIWVWFPLAFGLWRVRTATIQ